MGKIIKIVAYCVAIPLVIAGSLLIYLIYPGTPSRSHSMNFDGYIDLPKGGSLNVLDYLTIKDHTLFVTAESSGAVFKVNLDPTTQLADGNVSRLPGSGSVHGVMIIPAENVSFAINIKENKVDDFD